MRSRQAERRFLTARPGCWMASGSSTQSFPPAVGKQRGSALGLADSVEPELENLAPVPNSGSAFAPNMVAVALWIGAVMSAYLFNMNLMPASLAGAPRLAQTLGKFVVPAMVTLLQASLVFLMLVFGLGLQTPHLHLINLLLTMAVASWAFLAMLFALLRVFGEASKLLAVLLLTLQLAAGGGVIPVELSGGLFQTSSRLAASHLGGQGLSGQHVRRL